MRYRKFQSLSDIETEAGTESEPKTETVTEYESESGSSTHENDSATDLKLKPNSTPNPNPNRAVIWEYFSSASEKEAKEAVSKAKKQAEQRQLAEALEVGRWVLRRSYACSCGFFSLSDAIPVPMRIHRETCLHLQ